RQSAEDTAAAIHAEGNTRQADDNHDGRHARQANDDSRNARQEDHDDGRHNDVVDWIDDDGFEHHVGFDDWNHGGNDDDTDRDDADDHVCEKFQAGITAEGDVASRHEYE